MQLKNNADTLSERSSRNDYTEHVNMKCNQGKNDEIPF